MGTVSVCKPGGGSGALLEVLPWTVETRPAARCEGEYVYFDISDLLATGETYALVCLTGGTGTTNVEACLSCYPAKIENGKFLYGDWHAPTLEWAYSNTTLRDFVSVTANKTGVMTNTNGELKVLASSRGINCAAQGGTLLIFQA